MDRAKIEEKFLDLIEGKLPELQAAALRNVIENDPELSKSFHSYQKVIELETLLAREHSSAAPAFSAQVMSKIEEAEVGFFWRLFMELSANRKWIVSSLATCAVLVLVVKVAWDNQGNLKPLSRPEFKGPVLARDIGAAGVKESEQLPAASSLKKDKRRDRESGGDRIQSAIKPNGPVLAEEVVRQGNERLDVPAIGGAAQAVEPKLAHPNTHLGTDEKNKVLVDAPTANQAALPQAAGAFRMRSESMQISIFPPVWVQPNTEQYINYGENPRIAVSEQAVSTFSIDVDTGSYTNVRRFLERGVLPPANAVRIEEFINYFSYNYPQQFDKPFSISYEVAPAPLDQGRYLLKLGVKARDLKPSEKGWNLVFLVDVSGSMASENKLALVKRSLPLLVDKMRAEDRIAIVTYAGDAGLKLESSTTKDKAKILNAIESLGAGGSTYGSGGINLAYQVAAQNMIQGGVNRVILATDGDFNVGVTSHDELLRLIEEKRKSGITLTTIGVGEGNLKDGSMEQLANKGNGNYFYLDSFKEARKVLETDLVGNMEVVAKDVKLQIEFNPKHVAEYRLIGYENRKLENQDFRNDQIDAGEIGSGHTVTAMYEIVLANSELAKQLETEHRYQKEAQEKKLAAAPGFDSELAFLKVRFKQPDAQSSSELQFPIETQHVKQDIKAASDDFRFAAAVSYLGHLLRNSKFKGDYSFQDVIDLASGALGEDKLGYRREFVELVKNAKASAGRSEPVQPMPLTRE